MKGILISLCLLLTLTGTGEAKNLPEWAEKVVSADVTQHDPTLFDAVNLLIDHTCTVIDSRTHILHARECIRILNSDGESYGSKLLLLAPEDRITRFSAWIKYPDGRVKTLKKKDAVETQYLDDALYSKFRYSVMSLPKSCKGSIVCFEYSIRRRMSYPVFEWCFQEYDPTEKAVFTVETPRGYTLNYRVYGNQDGILPDIREQRYRFKMTGIPGLSAESFQPAYRDAAGWIAFRLAASEAGSGGSNVAELAWRDIAEWFRTISADAWSIPAVIKDLTDTLCTGIETQDETVAMLCRWVQKEIRYVQINLNNSGYVPNKIEDVLRVRYGDCKDMAFLLVSMLRRRGIDAWPVLCCGKDFGRVDPGFPSPGVFNHCIVGIQTDANRLHFVDPTNKWLAYPLLSPDLTGTYALVVREDGGELVEMHAPGSSDIIQHATVAIDFQGNLEISASETFSPQAAERLRYRFEKINLEEQQRLFRERITAKIPGAVVSDVEIKHLREPEHPLVMTCKISVTGGAGKMGSKLIFNPSFLPDIPVIVFTEDQRREPIDLNGVSRSVEQTVQLQIPDELELVEGIPGNTVESEFGLYRITCESDAADLKNVLIRKQYYVSDRLLPADRFGDVSEFFKSVANSERTVMIFGLQQEVR